MRSALTALLLVAPGCVRSALTALLLVAPGCAKDRLAPDPWADAGSSSSSGGDGAGEGESDGGASGGPAAPGSVVPWAVHVSADATFGERLAAQDIAVLVGQMTDEIVDIVQTPLSDCVPGSLQVAIKPDEPGDPGRSPATEQWSFAESRCDDGVFVELSGAGGLSRQHAAYAWLHRLGVRFFHPEQTYAPEQPAWGAAPKTVTMRPAFRWRGVRPEMAHPIELGDASDSERRSYARWQVANGATLAVFAQGVERGLARSAQLHLHRSAPGMPQVVDPTAGRSEEDQITLALQEALSKGPKIVHFTFDGPAGGEVADVDAVRQMTYVADKFQEDHPDVILLTSNRGVGGPPTPDYDVRFQDLSQFAPPGLGVKIRSHMFFDLFGPAPVYGTEDNSSLLQFMTDQADYRRIWHAPEASWWGTFDIDVPLYLPITMDARHRDIQGIAAMLEAGLDGHEVTGSGHEWGYWQNEWCSLRMSVDPEYGLDGCLTDLTDPMGAAAGEVKAVLSETIALQHRDLIDGDLLRWFVGTDPDVEVASAIGIEFHPLPPSPASVAGWPDEDLQGWLAKTGPDLAQSAQQYAALVLRLHEVEQEVSEGGRPWFDEIRDGITITGLRASHSLQAYGALVKAALADRTGDDALGQEARDDLVGARRITELAKAVIGLREAAYRYAPLSRSVGGGPDGDQDDNWTAFDHRYLNRTHRALYWTRIDDGVDDSLAGGASPVDALDVILTTGQELILSVPDPSLGAPQVDFGDGSAAAEGRDHAHAYAEAGVYPLLVTGQRQSGPWEYARLIAVVEQEWASAEARVVEPAGAVLVTPLVPGIVFGDLPAGAMALGFDGDDDGDIALGDWRGLTWAVDGQGVGTAATAAQLVTLPLSDAATGARLASLPIETAVFQRPAAPGDGVASLSGSLSTEALIDAVTGVGAFDEAGAREALADVLGFTAATLPEDTPFRLEWDFTPPPPPPADPLPAP